MTSHLYNKPTRSRTQKLVLVLLAVIVVLIAALLFVWLKPASSTTPGAVAPTSSASASATAVANGAPASSGGTAAPATGPPQWGIPVPGDGGPSTKGAAGVPRGYDASDAGATKAAINAVAAARWMKFHIDNPASALAELAMTDEAQRATVITQFTPVDPRINAKTGKHDVLVSPAGGKVLGAHLVQRDAETAKVQVLWEQFDAPQKGLMTVAVEPIGVELRWENGDWLVSGIGTFPGLSLNDPTKIIGELGQLPEWVPVPSEGWYW